MNSISNHTYKNDWFNKLDQVKQYIDINNKRPSQHDEIKNINILGIWLSTQVNNSKQRKQIMKDDDIYKAWTEFITSDIYNKYFLSNKDDWYNKLELVKQYIDINHKRPSQHDKTKDIIFLGKWVSTQLKNSKKREHIMADDDIYKSWTEFITSDIYNKYFLSNKDDWYNKLELVKQYIDNYKKDLHNIIKPKI